VDERDWLAERFETHRSHLRAVAYRMLGSLSEADDAVQESWLRLSRTQTAAVENLGGWLTTVVARICLDMLRSRTSRREEPFGLPDPIISRVDGIDPEQQALLADSVGLALLVVLQALKPAERLAFVLHDMFGVPFDEIGPIVGRSPDAAKMLASRARRRVQATTAVPDTDLPRQREIARAFLAASRDGDFDALVAVLDPDVILRVDGPLPGEYEELHGASNVAERALIYSRFAQHTELVLINGVIGLVTVADGQPISALAFNFRGDRILEIDVLADATRLRHLGIRRQSISESPE